MHLANIASLDATRDAWQTFFDNKKAAKSLTKPTSSNKQGQPKKSKAIPDSKLSVHSRVPWASLEFVSEFTDGSSTLPQLSKAIQNGKGVVFCELDEMDSMLQLSSENALAILVPPKADRHRFPTGFTGSGYNILVIAKQAGVEVLKHCIVKTTHERCGPFSLVVLSQRRGRVTTSSGPTLSETLSSKTLQVS